MITTTVSFAPITNVQDVVSGVNILCALIVNQSAKFITLVGQDYNALNVKN